MISSDSVECPQIRARVCKRLPDYYVNFCQILVTIYIVGLLFPLMRALIIPENCLNNKIMASKIRVM